MDGGDWWVTVHGVAKSWTWVRDFTSLSFHLMSLETWPSYWVEETKENSLPRWFSGKESTCKAADLGLIPGSGISPGGRNGKPLQYSCLGNPMDRRAWGATVHGVEKWWTWLWRNSSSSHGECPTLVFCFRGGGGAKRKKVKYNCGLFVRKVWPFSLGPAKYLSIPQPLRKNGVVTYPLSRLGEVSLLSSLICRKQNTSATWDLLLACFWLLRDFICYSVLDFSPGLNVWPWRFNAQNSFSGL